MAMDTNDMRIAAEIFAAATAAQIELTSMIAANVERDQNGRAQAYGEEAFACFRRELIYQFDAIRQGGIAD